MIVLLSSIGLWNPAFLSYFRCTQFLEKETVISLKELLPSNRQKVITELMVKFHAHKTRVVSAFSWLAKNDDGMHIEEKDKLSTSQLVRSMTALLPAIVFKFIFDAF